MDEQIGTFCAFTSGTPDQAQRYLALTDGNVEQAVELFFSNPDLGAAAAPSAATPAPAATATQNAPITIDDDDEVEGSDDDIQETGSRPAPAAAASHVESDEEMARRLQEEMYGAGGSSRGAGGMGGMGVDEDGYRAPIGRRTETLAGPNADWRDEPTEMNAAIAHQLMNRHQRGGRGPPAGIFNQRESRSIWANDDPSNPEIHNQVLSRATGGASEQTSKANLLADLFRPPFDLISPRSFSDARDDGKEDQKWILVNVQDPSIFDCQVLNRDIWKNQSIRDTITEHFIFLQYNKNDPRGQEYVNYYFSSSRDSDAAYPHIAIVDPRTGEQVKTWSGSPGPKPADFLMDLHEFLDRYSLSFEKKNPVQTKRKEAKKDVSKMSEEEQLELAMQASMANGSSSSGPKDEDPDALTKAAGKGKAPMGSEMDVDEPATRKDPKPETPFSLISSTSPQEEPTTADPKAIARIQFRHSGGRVVRRFLLNDPVRRIYEWLKAAPLEGQEGATFELVSMGKNLIDILDTTIGEAGLSGGTVMVEHSAEDDEEGA